MTAPTRGPDLRATTILAVRHRGRVVMGGDGQVTVGQTVMKHNARKVRRLYQERVLAGFAGAGADALTLFERFIRVRGGIAHRRDAVRQPDASQRLAEFLREVRMHLDQPRHHDIVAGIDHPPAVKIGAMLHHPLDAMAAHHDVNVRTQRRRSPVEQAPGVDHEASVWDDRAPVEIDRHVRDAAVHRIYKLESRRRLIEKTA